MQSSLFSTSSFFLFIVIYNSSAFVMVHDVRRRVARAVTSAPT